VSIIEPHPQAVTCFAREQGYLIARVEPAYAHLAPQIVAALNATPPAKEPRA